MSEIDTTVKAIPSRGVSNCEVCLTRGATGELHGATGKDVRQISLCGVKETGDSSLVIDLAAHQLGQQLQLMVP